jgi:hypothetical protein
MNVAFFKGLSSLTVEDVIVVFSLVYRFISLV